MANPLKVFVSYSHADSDSLERLSKHLTVLKRLRKIDEWKDIKLQGGVEWKEEITAAMENANIFLLLISADFLASDFIYSVELKHALEKHVANQARVIPIVLKECDWFGLPVEIENPKTGEKEDFTLGRLQALPWEGKPVWGPTHSSPDAAFTEVAQGISKVVNQMLG